VRRDIHCRDTYKNQTLGGKILQHDCRIAVGCHPAVHTIQPVSAAAVAESIFSRDCFPNPDFDYFIQLDGRKQQWRNGSFADYYRSALTSGIDNFGFSRGHVLGCDRQPYERCDF